MASGDSNPFMVIGNDGKRYIAKMINVGCNGKGLFNELVAARLAKKLGLPIPEFSIGRISAQLVQENREFKDLDVKPGPCFLSQFVPGTALITPVSLKFVKNKSDFPNIMLFDDLIMNTDRGDNKGNWYISRKEKKLIIIDHERIFENQQIWDSVSLEKACTNPPHMVDALGDSAYQILANQFPKGPNPFSPFGRKVQLVTSNDVTNFTDNIPDEWKMSSDDIVSARTFLDFQISHVDDIIKQLETKFRKKKGA